MSEVTIPDEFPKIINDFVKDILITFPEMKEKIEIWWKDISHFSYIDDEEEKQKKFQESQNETMIYLFKYCKSKYPTIFFDILYQNNTVFESESTIDTNFLPNIDFKLLWNMEISDRTRETIWKYLQLILFCIIGTVDKRDAFGDSAKLIDSLDSPEFKSSLENSLSQISDLFQKKNDNNSSDTDSINLDNLPNADNIHSHLSGMLDGKLGSLAKEFAEDFSDVVGDVDNIHDVQDVFSNLIKNPAQLMNLVKNVGNKLDNKMQSGEINETDLMKDVANMVGKMKDVPGIGNLEGLIQSLGIPGKGKVDLNAMQNVLNQQMKSQETKERIRSNIGKNSKKEKNTINTDFNPNNEPVLTEEEIIKLFENDTLDKKEKTSLSSKNKKKKTKK